MRKPTFLEAAFMQHPLQRLSTFAVTVMLTGALASCGGQPTVDQSDPATGTQPGVVDPALPGPGDLEATPLPGALPGDTDATGLGTDQVEGEITFSEIADDPEAFTGQTVTLRGTLGEVIGAQAFTLNEPAALGFDSLLIVGVDPAVIPMDDELFSNGAAGGTDMGDTTLDDDAQIIVTGVVRELDLPTLEQEMNYQFPDPAIGAYNQETVIIADDVQVIHNATP
jgi:hypothetical protein